MAENNLRQLHQLALLYGVQTAYYDTGGRRRQAAPEALLATLRALGAPVEGAADVPGALRERVQDAWRRRCEPVTVAWEGEAARVELRLPALRAEDTVTCRLELEDGRARRWTHDLARLPLLGKATVEGKACVARSLPIPWPLPPGYHRLTLTFPDGAWETLVMAAPRRAYLPAGPARTWGVFVPLYALHAGRSWGTGDLTDLAALVDWVRELGGGLTGTLPLLAAFLDTPCDPSPYAPASRLFWNELYLDPTRLPELEVCPEAREILASPAFRDEMAALRAAPLVDYRRALALKRRVLEPLARACFEWGGERLAALRRWAAGNPAAEDYARFRAAVSRTGAVWNGWPAAMRDGALRERDYDPEIARYHLYVQWATDAQLREVAGRAREGGAGLYLDLPLGVHRAGYDVWRERAAFALEADAGAPPDSFFPAGQNWGFPPLHPERIRAQGYRYFIACLRQHMRAAGVLRLDHVMGLHRLFWVPRGAAPRDGVYVRYRAEEFYAILALESHRHRTLVVGEDLGTVPRYVRAAMARHGLHRMYILPFVLPADPRQSPPPPPVSALAGLNTHDTPPFAAFWEEAGRGTREALTSFLRREGRLAPGEAGAAEVLAACLAHLAAGRARLLLVNLEDLWLETAPQNVPGTGDTHPNWRRKARYALEEFTRLPGVRAALRTVARLRREPAV
ncbi:MAG: 4-alpha-glucanotransferase [Bacillota bacterium]